LQSVAQAHYTPRRVDALAEATIIQPPSHKVRYKGHVPLGRNRLVRLPKSLGRFVADLSPNRLPEEAACVAGMGFIDSIGTMIAGRDEDSVRILSETLAPGDGSATLTFGDRRAPAPEATWINGTAANALDYDDVGLRGHPSTVLVPAILAEAEHLAASGAEMIAAYVAGYETWAELFRRDSGRLHRKGWHPAGLYGAVAACAKLLKLGNLPIPAEILFKRLSSIRSISARDLTAAA
jgi:2-methylcitrate dehydratase PrpD